MTYAGFLLAFVAVPAGLLGMVIRRRGDMARRTLLLPLAVSLVAVLYTTPWDNYLVARQVWWYDPQRISGMLLGWVPLEEYLFFLLQPLLTGWWTLWIARTTAPQAASPTGAPRSAPRFKGVVRVSAVLLVGLVWVVAAMLLQEGLARFRYLALILVWSLPPLALQLGYGAQLLWRLRQPALISILSSTLYLAAADSLMIAAGVWTINPGSSTGWLLFNLLPIEELLFFLMTNCLIAFSVLLLTTPTRAASSA